MIKGVQSFAAMVLLGWLPASSWAATNVSAIQNYTTGTNGGLMSPSVVSAGNIGVGTWDMVTGDSLPNKIWRIGTNVAYRIPYWATVGGTNFDAVSTNWAYYDLGSNAPANDWSQYRYNASGGPSGSASNLTFQFYMMLDGVASTDGAAPNIDAVVMYGNVGEFCVLQLALRTNSAALAYAHSSGELGAKMNLETNVVYFVSISRNALELECDCQIFNATNNFLALTNHLGGTGSQTSLGESADNSFEGRVQANYLNYFSSTYYGSGRIWISSVFVCSSDEVAIPAPETNSIVSDRKTTWTVGSNVGIRGTRPVRTVETNAMLYGVTNTLFDVSTNLNTALSTAASNTVVVLDGANGRFRLNGTLSFNKDGVTLRGTNNAIILLGAGGTFNMGPTALSAGQAFVFFATNGIAAGATNGTLTTNYSDRAGGGYIAPNQVYRLSQLNGDDPALRRLGVSGAERGSSVQDIVILTTNGNTFTFWPPAVVDFTNTPALVQLYTTVRKAMGLENITITTTNAGEYYTNGGSRSIAFKGAIDSWITGSSILYGNDYMMDVESVICSEINSNLFRFPSPDSGSHGGIQVSGGNPFIYDNIIEAVDRAFQFFGGVSGAVLFGNYIAPSNGQQVRYHSSGNTLNLFEANLGGTNAPYILGDGYFGSNEKGILFRNEAGNVSHKRFSSQMTSIGNSFGTEYLTLRYDKFSPVSGSTYEIFEMGNPFLGSTTTNGLPTSLYDRGRYVSGPAWNFPNTEFTGGFGVPPYLGAGYTNIFHKFTDVATEISNGTNILGDFSAWPFDTGGAYAIVFQDGVNTNKYWHYADFTNSPTEQVSVSLRAWTYPSNFVMVLNRYMPISNGWTMLIANPLSYQQIQTIDDWTHQRHFNAVITNGVQAVVYEPETLPLSIDDSILYPDGPPDWWDEEWPAVDPARSPIVVPNPAKVRYDALVAVESATTGTRPPGFRGLRMGIR